MDRLRTFFMRHSVLAFGVIALALCLKIVVPSGYMVSSDSHTFTVQVCHDASGARQDLQITVPVKSYGSDTPGKPAKGECPYGALSMATLGGADAFVLALALAFIVALGLAPIRFALHQRLSYLRPPLRGPPALI